MVYHIPDLRLASGSPCIDAGNNSAVPADVLDLDDNGDTSEPVPVDLAGRPRFMDDPASPDTGLGTPPIVDMGAYEHQSDDPCCDEFTKICLPDTVQNITTGTWYCRIQDAIDAANEGDEIVLNPGTYTGPGNRDLDFGGKNLTVRSIDPLDPDVVAATVIDCQGTPEAPHRAFKFHSGETAASLISGLTITNGYAPFEDIGGTLRPSGGAILCLNACPTISHCLFTDNQAGIGLNGESSLSFELANGKPGGDGGAICAISSNLVITNSTIINNRAGDGGKGYENDPWALGGAAGRGGALYLTGVLTIADSFIVDNTAGSSGTGAGTFGNCMPPGGDGGAICVEGHVSITTTSIMRNRAGTGSNDGCLTARGGDGGGLHVSGTAYLTHCVLGSNAAGGGGFTDVNTFGPRGGSGGGVFALGSLEIESSVFYSNRTGNGGGSVVYGGHSGSGGAIATNGDVTVVKSLFVGNETPGGFGSNFGSNGGDGAGMHVAGFLTAISNVFVANRSGSGGSSSFEGGHGGSGGGIFLLSPGPQSSMLANTVLAANMAGPGGFGGHNPGHGGHGGGIHVAGEGTLDMINSTILKNIAGQAGGTDPDSGDPFGVDGTGGGVNIADSVVARISNSIFWANVALSGSQFSGAAALTYSNVQDWASGGIGIINADPMFRSGENGTWTASAVYDPNTDQSTLTDGSANWLVGQWTGGVLNADPEGFAYFAIAGNSESTLTVWGDATEVVYTGLAYRIHDYGLRPGSPCIDAGDNDAVPPDILDVDEDNDTSEPLPLDLAGNLRFVDDPDTPDTGLGTPPIVDMGAYEYQPVGSCCDEFTKICLPEAVENITTGTWYCRIQDAIDAGKPTDEVVVWPGVYLERLNISTDIHVRGTAPFDEAAVADTVIDGGGCGPVVRMSAGILEGFTIRNPNPSFLSHCGAAAAVMGDAILRHNVIADNATYFEQPGGVFASEHALVTDNLITGNGSGDGSGGVQALDSARILRNRIIGNSGFTNGGVRAAGSALVERNFIIENNGGFLGGGVRAEGSAIVRNNVIKGNRSDIGAGVAAGGSSVIRNNTIVENEASLGSIVELFSSTTFECNIVSDNIYKGLAVVTGQGESSDYNCIANNQHCTWDGSCDGSVNNALPGQHNIYKDCGLAEDGIHLEEGSPCVNACNPDYVLADDERDIDGEPRRQQCRLDIGADETPYNSHRNPCGVCECVDEVCIAEAPHPASIDGDCHVDWDDFRAIWGCLLGPESPTPLVCQPADINGDGSVDLRDIAALQASFTAR